MTDASRRDVVHVAAACDEAYAMPLAAMLASVLAHLDPRCELVIHAMLSSVSSASAAKLERSLRRERVRWNRIELDSAKLAHHGFTTRPYEHFSPVTFFRLLLPGLLPAEIERVLYLDSDLVVHADISALWQLDIADFAIAAVAEWNPNAAFASAPAGIRHYRDLGLAPDQRLFNAGVLLLNLSQYRRERLAHRSFAYLRAAGPDQRWYEQEALNVVTRGRFFELDRRWNVPLDRVAELRSGEVAIRHYLTAAKPWHWNFDRMRAMPFYEALDRTAWAGWRPEPPRLARVRNIRGWFVKALHKRLHALSRLRWRIALHARYANARVNMLPAGAYPPRRSACEIRLFLDASPSDAALEETLIAFFDAGVDRAIVLVDLKSARVPENTRLLAGRVHVFQCNARSAQPALHKLLAMYGCGHWCVLGRNPASLPEASGAPLQLRALCAQLDRCGEEFLHAVRGTGERVELTARDMGTGRMFTGAVYAHENLQAYEPLVIASRVALLRYTPAVLLDADMTACGNARESARVLRIRAEGSQGELSAVRPSAVQERRS